MKIKLKIFYLALTAIAVDQLSKLFFFSLKHTGIFIAPFCNRNIAWSLSVGSGFFYSLWIAIIVIVVVALLNAKNGFTQISLTLIISGALSNMLDRLSRGCVADFIDIKFWPVFNLADVFITAGVILLIINLIKKNRPA